MPHKAKAAGGADSAQNDVEILAKRLEKATLSSADSYFGHPIAGALYKKGLKGGKCDAGAPRAAAGAWQSDAAASYPPEFTHKTLRAFPEAVRTAGAGAAGEAVRVRWGADEFASVEEWNAKIKEWDKKYPNVIDQKGATLHETSEFRLQQTNKPEIVMACWDALPNPVPSRYTGYARAALNHFKVDRYGNVICLRETVSGGRANDGALTFFDIDHIFPWSRGGRSRMDNFEAVQCSANRHVKCNNLVQMLNPRDMNCGIRYEQLIAMVDFVLQNFNDERNTTHSWLEKIVFWLTKSPENGKSFSSFQDDVEHSCDGKALMQYFLNREAEEAKRAILGKAGGGDGGAGGKVSGKAAGKQSPLPLEGPPQKPELLINRTAPVVSDNVTRKKLPSPPLPAVSSTSNPVPSHVDTKSSCVLPVPDSVSIIGTHSLLHKRPPGRAPKGENGISKVWDANIGSWVEAPH